MQAATPLVSIVIPFLDEEGKIIQCLERLPQLPTIEIILVDGGSQDRGVDLIKDFFSENPYFNGRLVFSEQRGRAAQMNFGASRAKGEVLFFLHADSLLESSLEKGLVTFAEQDGCCWGFCHLELDNNSLIFKTLSWFINKRSRITSVATGDLGLFVKRSEFERLEGFPRISLMEDVALSKKLKKISQPYFLKQTIISSARRWQKEGLMKTVLLMWYLRLAYFLGASPDYLHKKYYQSR